MLQHFLNQRVQIYFDFVLNLVDVRDVAAGLVLAMRHGQCGHRYILSGEAIPLSRLLSRLRAISGRKAVPVPVPAMIAQTTAIAMDFVANHVTHRAPAATKGYGLRCGLNRFRVKNHGASSAMRHIRSSAHCVKSLRPLWGRNRKPPQWVKRARIKQAVTTGAP